MAVHTDARTDAGADPDLWQRHAACRGPESTLFFAPTTPEPRPVREAREARAKRIYAECAVQPECLDYAVRIREPHGIWGGLNEAQRRHLIEQQPQG